MPDIKYVWVTERLNVSYRNIPAGKYKIRHQMGTCTFTVNGESYNGPYVTVDTSHLKDGNTDTWGIPYDRFGVVGRKPRQKALVFNLLDDE